MSGLKTHRPGPTGAAKVGSRSTSVGAASAEIRQVVEAYPRLAELTRALEEAAVASDPGHVKRAQAAVRESLRDLVDFLKRKKEALPRESPLQEPLRDFVAYFEQTLPNASPARKRLAAKDGAWLELGLVAGWTASVPFRSVAIDALHEVGGHIYLGGGLVDTRPDSWVPHYGSAIDTPNGNYLGPGADFHTDGFQALGDVAHGGVGEKLRAVEHLYFGDGDKFAGLAYPDSGANGTSPVGEKMGNNLSDAWKSIAGPLPELFLEGIAYTGGLALRDRNPILGYSLLTGAAINNLCSADYAFEALGKSTDQLSNLANQGHDYANFAVKVGDATRLPAPDVAAVTALGAAALPAAVAFSFYLHGKAKRTETVPDSIAIQHWLSTQADDPKFQDEFRHWLKQYPNSRLVDAAAARFARACLAPMKDPSRGEDKE